MATVLVEIWSDVVCPWCYVGKRRFEAALDRYPERERVILGWRAFQLDPSAPREPQPVLDAYARKFGGPERAAAVISRLTGIGAAAGIEMRFDRALRVNTFDAHRVIWLAGSSSDREAQSVVEERLMRAYFTEGLDVSDRDTLVALAGECGMDTREVGSMLACNLGAAEVRCEIQRADELDVTGVPAFVFEGRFMVPGAQDPDTFLRILEKVAARSAAAG